MSKAARRRTRRKRNPTTGAAVLATLAVGAAAVAALAFRHGFQQRERERIRARFKGSASDVVGEQCPAGHFFDGNTCVPERDLPELPLPLFPPVPDPDDCVSLCNQAHTPNSPAHQACAQQCSGGTPPPQTPTTPKPQKPPKPPPVPGAQPDPLPAGLLPGSPAQPPCVAPGYARTPIRIPVDVFQSLGAPAQAATKSGLYFLTADAIRTFVQLVRARLETWPSLRYVVVRDALSSIMPCNWYVDRSAYTNAQEAIFTSAIWLADAVEMDMGWSAPAHWSDVSNVFTPIVPRTWLGLPAAGAPQLSKDQVVEILVADPNWQYPEHVFARATGIFDQQAKCYEVRIAPSFAGHDVKPRLSSKHGFGTGDVLCIAGSQAYRIFPKGQT